MKPPRLLRATLAMVGVCSALAPSQVGAQAVHPAPVQSDAPESPKIRMFRQSIARELRNQAPAPSDQQKAPKRKRSWMSRHKVLTAVLIGVTTFVVWGTMLWNTCSGGGC